MTVTHEEAKEIQEDNRKAMNIAQDIVASRQEKKVTRDVKHFSEDEKALLRFLSENDENIEEFDAEKELKYQQMNSFEVYDPYKLTKEQIDALFESTESSDIDFNLTSRIVSGRAPVEYPCPTILSAQVDRRLTKEQKAMDVILRKRIKCIMLYFPDDDFFEKRKAMPLTFTSNILGGAVERWTIPSKKVVALPLYVLVHFLRKGNVAPAQRPEVENVELHPDEIVKQMNENKKTAPPEYTTFGISARVEEVRKKFYVFFKRLENVRFN